MNAHIIWYLRAKKYGNLVHAELVIAVRESHEIFRETSPVFLELPLTGILHLFVCLFV